MLEFFLNYADKEEVKSLFKMVGIRKAADTFFKQIKLMGDISKYSPMMQYYFSPNLKNVHFNILSADQQKLLPLILKFKREYFMVGGTSTALHINYRMSIDFNLFKNGAIKPKAITKKI